MGEERSLVTVDGLVYPRYRTGNVEGLGANRWDPISFTISFLLDIVFIMGCNFQIEDADSGVGSRITARTTLRMYVNNAEARSEARSEGEG